MVTTIYLVRHCQAEGNLQTCFHGQTDGKITEMGKAQLKALTRASADWNLSAIYSSPLTRAFATAEAINENYHLPIVRDDQLKEINCGEWEGKSWADLHTYYAESLTAWEQDPKSFESPGGESMQQVYDRIVSAIDGYLTRHRGQNIAIAGHAAIFRCYLSYVRFGKLGDLNLIGWGDNTNISKITFDSSGKPTLCYQYDASHLTPDISTIEMRKRLKAEAARKQK